MIHEIGHHILYMSIYHHFVLPHRNFFIAFLDELGNFKHFEPYLFFGQVLIKSAVECGRTVRPGADGCGRAEQSAVIV